MTAAQERSRLVIFDVDGTLVDSQAHILAAMRQAFAAEARVPPTRDEVLAVVGLSLPEAMLRLAPDADMAGRAVLVDGYKSAFAALRTQGDSAGALSPLYEGAQAALSALMARGDVHLAIATGKSRRGLDHVLELHGLRGAFSAIQVADDHPSKPHPSMIWACLRETGARPDATVMLGDTSYDMEMAQAGGVRGIGVAWGYHPPRALIASGAHQVLASFDELMPALDALWGDGA